MKLLKFFDKWMFEVYAPCVKSLPLFRIIFALYLLLFYLPRYAWMAGMPDAFFLPPISLAELFSGLPSAWFLYGLDFFLELGAFCLLFGRYTRLVSFALFVGIIVGNSFRYSLCAKIDHDIMVPAALFCLGFSSWGNRFSFDEVRISRSGRRNHSSWPVALLMMVLGFCMSTSVVLKMTSGWLNPHVYASRAQTVRIQLQNEQVMPLGNWLLQIHSPFFWKLTDWSTLAIEGAFIICIFSLPAIRVLTALAVFFHATVYFTMGIFFSYNAIVYACLFDFCLFLRKARIRHGLIRFRCMAHQIRIRDLLLPSALLLGVALLFNSLEIDCAWIPDSLFFIASLSLAIYGLLRRASHR